MRFLPILASFLAAVAASPFPEPTGDVEKRATACKDNRAYKSLSSQGPKGSIYCNDYLHLTTSTVSTAAPLRTITAYVTTTSYNGKVCRREAEVENPLEKRQLLDDVISQGCSCLSLKPRTVTVTTYTPDPRIVPKTVTTTTCSAVPQT